MSMRSLYRIGDVDQRIEQRIGEEVRLQAQVDQLGMLGVVVMLFGFHARIGQMIDLDLQAQFLCRPSAPSAPVPARRTAR